MKKIFKLSSILFVATPLVGSTACSNNELIFANFESYMSPDLIESARGQFGAKFINYSTNEEIMSKFTNYYDVAVPSSYEMMNMLEKNILQKIQWEKFELHKNPTESIKNGTDALELLTDTVQNLIINQSTDLIHKGLLKPGENILDYGIPYFLQSFVFGYKGSEISEIASATDWDQLSTRISPKNPNQDNRFKPHRTSKIGCVDDVRTVYDLAKLTKDQALSNDPTKWNINPDKQPQKIFEYENDYSTFIDKFANKQNNFYFNSDSQQILQSIASDNGNQSSFAYNGDLLYAAQGAGLFEPMDGTNFHIFNPVISPMALDMIVLNKKNENNETKNQKVYDLVKYIALDHVDATDVKDKDSEGNYKYGPMINFDTVAYTDPFKNINDYIMSSPTDNYFSDAGYTDKQIELYQKIYDIKNIDEGLVKKLMEDPISNLDKSNMNWAYNKKKELI